MSDIIERLRSANPYSISFRDVRKDAADEIERLQAERDALKDHVHRLESLCHDMAGELTVLRAIKQMQAAINAARGET